MNTSLKIITLLIFIFSNRFYSQSNDIFAAQTKLIIQSEDGVGKPFNVYSESALMNLSLSTGDFLLKADLSAIRTGDRYLDSVIRSRPQQTFIFKGKMNSDNLYLINQQSTDEKSYNLEGQLTINNVSIPCVAQFDPVNFSEKTDTKKYRMDFKLVIDPAKITILGLENKLNKQVVFEVMDGPLNTQP
ncbi:MAG: hypothetical protein V4580_01050 [Bacteroidota bacterium]